MTIPRQDHIEKIDDITVEDAVGKVAQNTTGEQGRAEARGCVQETPAAGHDGESHEGDGSQTHEESVVVLEHSKRGAGVVDLHKVEKPRDDRNILVGGDRRQHDPLGHLVEHKQRKRQKKKQSHKQLNTPCALCPLWSITPEPLHSGRRGWGARGFG